MIISTALSRCHCLPAGEEASVQERLENVLEGPSSNSLASKRPKLSYSASSLAEDKKNFLYTLMGEVLQQCHKARGLLLAGSSCIGQPGVQEQHPPERLLEQAQGRRRCPHPLPFIGGFNQAAAAC